MVPAHKWHRTDLKWKILVFWATYYMGIWSCQVIKSLRHETTLDSLEPRALSLLHTDIMLTWAACQHRWPTQSTSLHLFLHDIKMFMYMLSSSVSGWSSWHTEVQQGDELVDVLHNVDFSYNKQVWEGLVIAIIRHCLDTVRAPTRSATTM